MNSNSEETLRLVSKLLEQEIGEDEFAKLNDLLEHDPEARQLYIRAMHMHEQLPDIVLSKIPRPVSIRFPEELSDPKVPTGPGWTRNLISLSVGGIIAASLVASVFWFWNPLEHRHDGEVVALSHEPTEPLDPNVAVVTETVGVEWSDTPPLSAGDGAAPGLIRLEQGMLQLEFYCGAAVLLEGPAELEIKSSMLAVLQSGRLRAHVPPEARGFTILSHASRLVDLGTEFGVFASPEGETQVHVFDGLVDLFPRSDGTELSRSSQENDADSVQHLSTGNGVRIGANGERQSIDAEGSRFVSFMEFSERVRDSSTRRREAWQQSKRALQSDRRLFAWFDFDRTLIRDRRVHALEPAAGSLSGAMVGCRLADGRWPGDTSLEFKHPGDRVRLSLPERLDSVTLMAWVRIDGLDRSFNGLLMADGDHVGRPHWQINRHGHLVFGVRLNADAIHNYKSDSIINEFNLGQWTQIATVYDQRKETVQHYSNGELRSTEKMVETVKLQWGNVELGNWRNVAGKTRTPIRNLNGRIDELMILRDALSSEEIQSLYESGRP